MTEKTGQTVAYLRVSSGGQNLARQEDLAKEADKVFREKASAASRDRPELKNAMEWLREGDRLIVHSIDRLARNVPDLRSIVDELTQKGVTVEFKKEGLVFSPKGRNAMSDLLLGVMGSFAEFERSLMLERQAEANAKARAEGRPVGRQRVMTDELVAQAAARVAQGVPKSVVARDMKVARTTLIRELKLAEAKALVADSEPKQAA